MITRAALLAGLGVALGAFGAHGLKPLLDAHQGAELWRTAVLYHLVHAVALLALGIWMHADERVRSQGMLRAAALFWTAGVACFCGSLYALAIGVPARWIWPVTPGGGVCFLIGWTLLAIGARRIAGVAPRTP